MSKRKRNRNPYLLTTDEKLAVVDLYARFATTTQVIDEVMKWKPEAATGDDAKNRKNTTDAIRTCNPNSSVFSFQVTLQAQRAEYLAEQSGGLVTAVSSMVSTLKAQLPNMQLDLSAVDLADLPKIVNALKDLHSLMKEMGITNKSEISEAIDFGSRLDEYPKCESMVARDETRRQTLAETENHEAVMSEQIDKGTNRSPEDIEDGMYPDNYVFPDCMIEGAWQELCSDDIRKKPSISQMRKEIEEISAPDGKISCDAEYYWWDEILSLESRLDYGRQYLSSDWSSYTLLGKEREIEREEEEQNQMLLIQAELLGIDWVEEQIFTPSELRNRINELTGRTTYMEKLENEAKATREARESNGASSQSSVAGNGHIQASGEQAGNESDPSED
jgi:hypothetical protein